MILSGTLGDHGTTIMIARGELELETDIKSDCAPLQSLVFDMLDEANNRNALDAFHCLRDPTRGGLATTLNEIALSAEVRIEIEENRIPVREEVKGTCEILRLTHFTLLMKEAGCDCRRRLGTASGGSNETKPVW